MEQYVKETPENLDIVFPEAISNNRELVETYERDFDQWICSGCEHEDMEYWYEYIGNIAGMSQLESAIRLSGGAKAFPVLGTQLPESNGGYIPLEMNEQLQKDLDFFMTKTLRLYEMNCSDIDSFISTSSDDQDLILAQHDSYTFFSHKGVFRIEQDKTVIFQATVFRVIKSGTGQYRFINSKIKNKHKNQIIIPISFDDELFEKKKELHFLYTSRKYVIKDEFYSTYNSFMNLLKASKETGNPICWC